MLKAAVTAAGCHHQGSIPLAAEEEKVLSEQCRAWGTGTSTEYGNKYLAMPGFMGKIYLQSGVVWGKLEQRGVSGERLA